MIPDQPPERVCASNEERTICNSEKSERPGYQAKGTEHTRKQEKRSWREARYNRIENHKEKKRGGGGKERTGCPGGSCERPGEGDGEERGKATVCGQFRMDRPALSVG